MSNRKLMSPKKVAIYGISIALVAALTFMAFPITPTRGYFNFGEVVIFFIAFMIGWKEAAICGAIGAALVDSLLAAFFVPATLVAKALEGSVAGALSSILKKAARPALVRTVAFSIGGSLMVLTYFLYEWLVLPSGLNSPGGLGNAVAELPFNVLQVGLCGIIAVLLTEGIERSYPQIANLRD